LEKTRQVTAPNSFHVQLAAQKLADYLGYLDRYDESIALLREVVAVPSGKDGTLSRFQANALNNLAATISSAGDNEAALELYEQLVADRIKAIGPDAIRTLRYRHSMALTLHEMGRYPEALAIERDVLARQLRVADINHPYTLRYAKVCAVLASLAEGNDAALAILRDVRERLGGDFENATGPGAEQVPLLIDYWNSWASPDDQITSGPLDATAWARTIDGWAADPQTLALARFAAMAGSAGSPMETLRLSPETVERLLTDLPRPIPAGDEWRFQYPPDETLATWWNQEADGGHWPAGRAEFGYGDGDETTVLDSGDDPAAKPIAARFRKRFDLSDAPARGTAALLFVKADDGARVFFNDREIARIDLPPGDLAADTLATKALGGELEQAFVPVLIPAVALRQGENLLAIEVRQSDPGSSDLSFDALLAYPLPDLATSAQAVKEDAPDLPRQLAQAARGEVVGDPVEGIEVWLEWCIQVHSR
jgi:hypothetical protein